MKKVNFVNYNFDSIKYFICIAKLESLSKAAKQLGISQSALSQSMKSLEMSLGVTLFNRNTRGIILTDAGYALYREANIGNDHIENGIVQALKIADFGCSKVFKISTSHTLFNKFILPIMDTIIAKYPTIDFEINTMANENNVVKFLQNGDIDLAIIKTDEKFIVKEIVVKSICELQFVFVYNQKYLCLEDGKMLNNIPIIIKKRTGKDDSSYIKVSFNRTIMCSTDNACLDLIKKGIGIGLYPRQFMDNELREIDIQDFKNIKRIVSGCYIKNNEIAEFITSKIIKYSNDKL